MFHVIVNPASRSGRALSQWKASEAAFRRAGVPYLVHYSERPGHVRQLCRALTAGDEVVRFVIFGGDGTVNEAINGVRDLSRALFGYVPTGSGNDLARDLQLPQERERLLQTILRGKEVRRIDLGEIEYLRDGACLPDMGEAREQRTRRFAVSCGIGYDAAICQEAAVSPLKKTLNALHLGKFIYLAAAVRQIMTAPMRPAVVEMTEGTDGDRTDNAERLQAGKDGGREAAGLQGTDTAGKTVWRFNRFLFLTVMNHRFEGGGFQFCPRADDRDGQLDLCAAADLNRLMFFRIFPSAYSGNHLRFHGVFGGRAAQVRIRTALPLWVHTDGEVTRKASELTVRCLPGALRLME